MSCTVPNTQDEKKPDALRFHVCISGFLQSERRRHGLFALSQDLIDHGYNGRFSRVSLRPWNACWEDVAQGIWHASEDRNLPVLLNIYAYSWGGGWGAVALANELLKRSVDVQTMVLSDAVHRHPNPLLRYRSLLRRDWPGAPKIRIPANVARVVPFHQTLNRPQGHAIVAGDGFSGTIYASKEVSATHQFMDDSRDFHRTALHWARRLEVSSL